MKAENLELTQNINNRLHKIKLALEETDYFKKHHLNNPDKHFYIRSTNNSRLLTLPTYMIIPNIEIIKSELIRERETLLKMIEDL